MAAPSRQLDTRPGPGPPPAGQSGAPTWSRRRRPHKFDPQNPTWTSRPPRPTLPLWTDPSFSSSEWRPGPVRLVSCSWSRNCLGEFRGRSTNLTREIRSGRPVRLDHTDRNGQASPMSLTEKGAAIRAGIEAATLAALYPFFPIATAAIQDASRRAAEHERRFAEHEAAYRRQKAERDDIQDAEWTDVPSKLLPPPA